MLAACSAEQSGDGPIVVTGPTMGTSYSVKLYAGADEIDSEMLETGINALLERINDQMSTYRPDSELSRFNASRELDWFPVSAETARVVHEALGMSNLSGGAFDVTVGPLVNLWGFGPERKDAGLPTAQAIVATMDRVGYRKLAARSSPPALRKQRPDVYVDLSAIAKGFAVDEVAGLLDEHRITSYLVEIGGELRARGVKPDGSPWKVAIERPAPGQRSIQTVVALGDVAIATSGDYRNFLVKGGKHYSHTIDPRTGKPVTHALASVSVIRPTAMPADALATAIMVMGPEAGFRLAVSEKIAAQLVVKSAEGFEARATPEFQRYLLR